MHGDTNCFCFSKMNVRISQMHYLSFISVVKLPELLMALASKIVWVCKHKHNTIPACLKGIWIFLAKRNRFVPVPLIKEQHLNLSYSESGPSSSVLSTLTDSSSLGFQVSNPIMIWGGWVS